MSITGEGEISSTRKDAEVRDDVTYRKVAWRLIPFLFVCYIVAYLDRINIGIAKLQMLNDLGLGNAAYAFGASVLFWGLIIFEIPSNFMMTRVGARAWISRIMISWGIGSTAVAFTAPIASALGMEKSTVFYILRFALGMCEAGFFPGVMLYLSYWFPSHRQTRALSGFLLAIPVSSVIGASLSGWIMDATNNWLGIQGWRWMIILEGTPAIILGLAVMLTFKNRPEQVGWLSVEEKLLIKRNLREEDRTKKHDFWAAVTDRRTWIMSAIYFTYVTGIFGVGFWLPTIIHASGVKTNLDVGLLSAIPYAGASIAMLIHAKHSRATGERRLHSAIPAFVGGCGLILSVVFAHTIPVAIFFLTVGVSGLMCVMTVVWTLPSGFLSESAAAAGLAIIYTAGNFSGIVGAYVSSLAIDVTGDVRNGTYVLAAFMLVSGAIVLLAPRDMFDTPHPNV
jgi:MFS family permease